MTQYRLKEALFSLWSLVKERKKVYTPWLLSGSVFLLLLRILKGTLPMVYGFFMLYETSSANFR